MKKKWLLGLAALLTAFATAGFAACVSETPQTPDNGGSTGDGTQTEQPDNGGNGGTTTPENPDAPILDENASVGLEYTLSEDGTYYVVTGIGTCTDTAIVISSTCNGKPVTTIGSSAFRDCSGLTSIEIPASVTSIGSHAFSGCRGLTSIEIPAGVTSIGDDAFSGCSSLTSIEIPESVTSIGDDAFDRCFKLQYNVENGLKYLGNDNNPYLYLANTESTDITRATINANCRLIGNWAFRNRSGLTSIEIPEGVTSIGEYAFFGCSGLTSIEIPEGVGIPNLHPLKNNGVF